MNVVHVGASDGGGAGHAMVRLHHSLRRSGVSSYLLVRSTGAPRSTVETVATRGDGDAFFPTVRSAMRRHYVERNRTARSNTHFSLEIDGADVSREPLVAGADVVHLHWISSFQTAGDVRRLLGVKPVVWTMHDLNPVTGGCHFPAGCEGYTDACNECPQLVADPFRVTETALRDKSELWASGGLTFIAPSRYMADLARRSAVARSAAASIVHIPFGIDVDAFRVHPMAAARNALGLPLDARIVLCGADQNMEFRKGMRFVDGVLAEASAACKDEVAEITLLTVGEPKLDIRRRDGGPVIQLGRVSNTAMPSVYAAADVFVHPAVEDNAPGMVLEALSCGTPVIAFDVGGGPEMIEDEISGRVLPVGDEVAMARAVSAVIRDPERRARMSASARARVEADYSDVAIARRHAELYATVSARMPRFEPAESIRTTGTERIFPQWSTACLVEEIAQVGVRTEEFERVANARSEHIATLQGDVADLVRIAQESDRQVHEKDAALMALHEIAAERETLTKALSTAIADLRTMAEGQRREIDLIHGVAAERRSLIEDLQRTAQERLDLIDELSRKLEQRVRPKSLWLRIVRRVFTSTAFPRPG